LLSRSLNTASNLIKQSQFDTQIIKESMLKTLEGVDRIDYVQIVDRQFRAIDTIQKGNTIILVAAYVGSTRLIDNLWV